MYTCPPDSQCQIKLVCIVTWKHGCSCVAVFLFPIHLICVPLTCMECEHTSVHVYMPTWFLNSAPSLMHSNMETWMSLCGNVCFAVIPLLFPDLGQNVYIHQYMYFSLPDSWCLLYSISILTRKDGFFCVSLCACSSHSTWGPTTWLQYVHASVHGHLSTWFLMSASPYLHAYMEKWVALCGTVVCITLPVTLSMVPHLG